MIVGYAFDLVTNELIPRKVANPGAGREHLFRAWRLTGSSADPVSLRNVPAEAVVPDADATEGETCD